MSEQGDMGKEGGIRQGALSQADARTCGVKAKSSGFELALAAVRGELGPITADEAPAFLSSIARARAAAEARRAPSPQLDLLEAA